MRLLIFTSNVGQEAYLVGGGAMEAHSPRSVKSMISKVFLAPAIENRFNVFLIKH